VQGKKEQTTVAYITDIFPRISLTFISLEIRKLRQKGMHIDLYAIWKPQQPITSCESEAFLHETTYLSTVAIWQLLHAHLYYVVRKPKEYCEVLKFCRARHANVRLRRRTVYNFLLAPYLAARLADKNIPHIHAHFASGAATIAMMAARLLNIGFSFTAHRGDILDENVLLNEKLKKASFVIAISEYNRRYLLRESPAVEMSKVKTIHCGVETDIFSPCQRIWKDSPCFLAVGNLLPRKGHVYLIEACRILREKGINYRCIIVGGGPQRTELENLIQKYRMDGQIELAGAVPHESIQSYYNRADIFVLASLSEGIPVVLMEAMSKGLAVIATSIMGIPELVSHEEDGILVNPGDPVELAESMMRVLKDRELKARLGKNARQKVLRNFNIDLNAEKIKELFEGRDAIRPGGKA
jgi:colanic acid/amylovoran biosynthesis glycosyltransferase